jgi:hypothetical protein
MMSYMRSLYIQKVGRGSALERYRGIVRFYAALTGGLLPLAPKSSGQTLRFCPCGLLRYPHGEIKIISVKRGVIYEKLILQTAITSIGEIFFGLRIH